MGPPPAAAIDHLGAEGEAVVEELLRAAPGREALRHARADGRAGRGLVEHVPDLTASR